MKQIVCESIRVIERGREGLSSSVFGKARREPGRGREWGGVFSSPSLGKTSFWDESDLERVLGG